MPVPSSLRISFPHLSTVGKKPLPAPYMLTSLEDSLEMSVQPLLAGKWIACVLGFSPAQRLPEVFTLSVPRGSGVVLVPKSNPTIGGQNGWSGCCVREGLDASATIPASLR